MDHTFKSNPRLNPSLIYAGCDAVVYELTIPEGAEAEVSIPGFSETWIHNGQSTTRLNFSPELKWIKFALLSKPIQAQIALTVTHNGVTEHEYREITLLPLCAWNMRRKYAQATAALALENSRTVMKFVQAAGCTPDPACPRSQTVIAQTLYEAFKRAFSLYYLYEKELFEQDEQSVRFPAQILHDGGGTCIDLALFYAAALWLAGCSPVIAILGRQSGTRHAIIGIWQVLAGYRPIVLTDAELLYAINAKQLFVVDPNWLTQPASSFAAAQQEALARIQRMGILWGIDIEAARHYSPHILSLPALVRPGVEDELVLDDLPKRFQNEPTTQRASQAAQVLSSYAVEVIASQNDVYTGMRLPLVTEIQENSVHASFQIGRDPASHLNFYKNPSISRDHAALIVSGDAIFLQDLGSKFGTRVSGHPLLPFFPEHLSVGDIFSLGSDDDEQLQLIKRTTTKTPDSLPSLGVTTMDDYDREKVDEIVLALMHLTLHDSDRAWKGFDWETLDRLYEKGWIENPRTKAKSVVLTEEGFAQSARLFQRHFGMAKVTQDEL